MPIKTGDRLIGVKDRKVVTVTRVDVFPDATMYQLSDGRILDHIQIHQGYMKYIDETKQEENNIEKYRSCS